MPCEKHKQELILFEYDAESDKRNIVKSCQKCEAITKNPELEPQNLYKEYLQDNSHIPFIYTQEGKSYKSNNEFLDLLFKEKKGLRIFGPYGTGKTQMLYSIAHAYWAHSKAFVNPKLEFPQIYSMTEIIRVLMESMFAEKRSTYFNLIEELKKQSVLFIDDFGTRKLDKESQPVYDVLDILDYRYTHSNPIVITTNLDIKDILNIYGERIGSRIYEMCEPVEVGGANKRLTRK